MVIFINQLNSNLFMDKKLSIKNNSNLTFSSNITLNNNSNFQNNIINEKSLSKKLQSANLKEDLFEDYKSTVNSHFINFNEFEPSQIFESVATTDHLKSKLDLRENLSELYSPPRELFNIKTDTNILTTNVLNNKKNIKK